MAVCEFLVSQDIAINCSSPIFAGIKPLGIIINKNDIASISQTGNVVDSIVLKSGKKGYQIEQMGQQPFNGTNNEMQEGDVMNTFNKVVNFIVLDNNPDVSAKVIEPMANGEFVVIIRNQYNLEAKKNGYEIIGLDKGARATSIVQNKYENMGGWACELTETETPNPSTFFFDTDNDTTETALAGLLVAAE